MGHRRSRRSAAVRADLRNHHEDISRLAQRPHARCLCGSLCGRHIFPDPKTPGRSGYGRRPPGVARRRGVVLHHPHFPDPIRSRMDHPRLGARRAGAALAVSRRAESRPALCRRRFALPCLRPVGAESRRARIPPAHRDADLELVPLRLRNHDRLPVRRRLAFPAAANDKLRAHFAHASLLVRRDPDLPAPEHRDRRLFLHRPDRSPFLSPATSPAT